MAFKFWKTFMVVFFALFVSVCAAKERNVGIQTFTFNKQTVEELLPMIKECGCNAVGMSRHKLSTKFPDVYVSPDMTAEQKAFLKKILAQHKMKIVSYGVVTPTTEKAIRKLMDFAKEFGINIIIAEPRPEKLELWDKLCKEYGIIVAVHNHGKDAKRNADFHDPKFVADMIKNYTNVYACPDTGHWARSGVNCVDGLKTLKGKIGIAHFRDMNSADSLSAYDVTIGTGAVGAKQMLDELDAQKFDGWLLLEYGGWWKNTLEKKIEEVKNSVKFIRKN